MRWDPKTFQLNYSDLKFEVEVSFLRKKKLQKPNFQNHQVWKLDEVVFLYGCLMDSGSIYCHLVTKIGMAAGLKFFYAWAKKLSMTPFSETMIRNYCFPGNEIPPKLHKQTACDTSTRRGLCSLTQFRWHFPKEAVKGRPRIFFYWPRLYPCNKWFRISWDILYCAMA